jgi:hypothetical protein
MRGQSGQGLDGQEREMITVLVACAIGLVLAGGIFWFAWWTTEPLRGYMITRGWPADRVRRP